MPVADARLEVAREEGRGELSATSATSGPDGLAAIDVRMPSGPDLTRIVFRMADDHDSYLPFDLVSAPVAEADLEPGEIRERLDVPKNGVILRFRIEPESDVVLIPYETDRIAREPRIGCCIRDRRREAVRRRSASIRRGPLRPWLRARKREM